MTDVTELFFFCRTRLLRLTMTVGKQRGPSAFLLWYVVYQVTGSGWCRTSGMDADGCYGKRCDHCNCHSRNP